MNAIPKVAAVQPGDRVRKNTITANKPATVRITKSSIMLPQVSQRLAYRNVQSDQRPSDRRSTRQTSTSPSLEQA